MRVVRDGLRPTLPKNADAGLAALSRLCWAADPGARPTAAAALDALELGAPRTRRLF